MTISAARKAAFEVLLRIEVNGELSSALLPEFEDSLEPRDRFLCHEIVLGVLRHRLLFDHAIDKFCGGKRLDPEVRIACHIGLYQSHYLDRVPLHAIVNDSVELVRRARRASATGFVNAFLRKYSKIPLTVDLEDELLRVSVETSHPLWLMQRWSEQFGRDEAIKLANANNEKPPITFRLTHTANEAILNGIEGISRSDIVPGCFITEDIGKLRSLMDSGSIYLQDEGSQLVGSCIRYQNAARILDLCAAPGGKTGQIASSGPAAFVLASDLSSRRIETMKRGLEKQGLEHIPIVQLDAERALPFPESSFDVVFIDAPCTGTGTIRHNPELRYRITDDEIRKKHDQQLRMLTVASNYVRKGGAIYYSTCSLERDENEDVITRFLDSDSGFEIDGNVLPKKFRTSDGFARTFPHRDEMDGFFIAKLVRI